MPNKKPTTTKTTDTFTRKVPPTETQPPRNPGTQE